MKKESVLRTGGLVRFEDIKVGEVFAIEGCWRIFYKMNQCEAIFLSDNFSDYSEVAPGENYGKQLAIYSNFYDCYRLPRKVQKLWAER